MTKKSSKKAKERGKEIIKGTLEIEQTFPANNTVRTSLL